MSSPHPVKVMKPADETHTFMVPTDFQEFLTTKLAEGFILHPSMDYGSWNLVSEDRSRLYRFAPFYDGDLGTYTVQVLAVH